ncbi:MAG: alternative ribosome rescue aminoacyl-tRNA hydrolase ArfB [Gemmatimonadaceae bacterium]
MNDRVTIPRGELSFRATRSGGAGGQHVNTSSTRVELLWNVRTSLALDDLSRERAIAHLAARLDGEGTLRIVASESRSQRRNRDAAEDRLAELVRGALTVRKKRVRTKPSRAVKAARLEAKRRQGETKRGRKSERWREDN